MQNDRPTPQPRPAPTPAPRPAAHPQQKPVLDPDDNRRKANQKQDELEKSVLAKIDAVVGDKKIVKPARNQQDLRVSGMGLDGVPFSFTLCVGSETPERELLGALAARGYQAQADSLKIEAVKTDRLSTKQHSEYSKSDLDNLQLNNPDGYEQVFKRNIITKSGSPSGT